MVKALIKILESCRKKFCFAVLPGLPLFRIQEEQLPIRSSAWELKSDFREGSRSISDVVLLRFNISFALI
jgi:hypothetical protein